MTQYRFELLDSAGKVFDKKLVECDDKEAALDQAGMILARTQTATGIEVWNGAHMVQCLKKGT